LRRASSSDVSEGEVDGVDVGKGDKGGESGREGNGSSQDSSAEAIFLSFAESPLSFVLPVDQTHKYYDQDWRWIQREISVDCGVGNLSEEGHVDNNQLHVQYSRLRKNG